MSKQLDLMSRTVPDDYGQTVVFGAEGVEEIEEEPPWGYQDNAMPEGMSLRESSYGVIRTGE